MLMMPPVDSTEIYGRLSLSGSLLPPLGITLLATILKNNGIVSTIFDPMAEGLDFEGSLEFVAASCPDIVGISILYATERRAVDFAAALKARLPEAIILLGGPQATLNFEELLSFGCELKDSRTSRIHGPDIAGGIDTDAVRDFIQSFSPRAENMAVAIDGDDGVGFVAALQEPDDAGAIHGDGGDHVEGPAVGRRLNRESSVL
jgi:hypothetical protein